MNNGPLTTFVLSWSMLIYHSYRPKWRTRTVVLARYPNLQILPHLALQLTSVNCTLPLLPARTMGIGIQSHHQNALELLRQLNLSFHSTPSQWNVLLTDPNPLTGSSIHHLSARQLIELLTNSVAMKNIRWDGFPLDCRIDHCFKVSSWWFPLIESTGVILDHRNNERINVQVAANENHLIMVAWVSPLPVFFLCLPPILCLNKCVIVGKRTKCAAQWMRLQIIGLIGTLHSVVKHSGRIYFLSWTSICSRPYICTCMMTVPLLCLFGYKRNWLVWLNRSVTIEFAFVHE